MDGTDSPIGDPAKIGRNICKMKEEDSLVPEVKVMFQVSLKGQTSDSHPVAL